MNLKKEQEKYGVISRKLKSEWGLTYDDRRIYFEFKKKLWIQRYEEKQITKQTLDNIIKNIDTSIDKIEKHNPHIIPIEEVRPIILDYDY